MGTQHRRRHTSVVLGKDLDEKVNIECGKRKQRKSDFIRQILWGFFDGGAEPRVIRTDANEIRIVISFDGLDQGQGQDRRLAAAGNQ